MEKVLKLTYIPFSLVTGLLAGIVGRKIFEQIWGVIDDQEPPDAQHRDSPWLKTVGALLVEGAIFRAVRGVVDRGSRTGFERLTGTWPGEASPDPN